MDLFKKMNNQMNKSIKVGNRPKWKYKQSGVVPLINIDGKLKTVLITSTKTGRWTIPKGTIEKNMMPWDSAAKEAHEEAGILGSVKKIDVGSYTYEKWDGQCDVTVYPLIITKVLDHWDEAHFRERKIVGIKKAMSMVEPEVALLIKSVADRFKGRL